MSIFYPKFSLAILTARLSKSVILLYHSNEGLRMSGSMPSLVCVPSWHAQGQFFFYFCVSKFRSSGHRVVNENGRRNRVSARLRTGRQTCHLVSV